MESSKCASLEAYKSMRNFHLAIIREDVNNDRNFINGPNLIPLGSGWESKKSYPTKDIR